MSPLLALLPYAAFAFFGQPPNLGTPVRATLDDGQLLVGDVFTEELVLITGQGSIHIPLKDVGEVVPANGIDLDVATENVSVWLRNGTELIGRWADPGLEMGISVGKNRATIDLPMDELMRFQTTGGEQWPVGQVYRVRTTWGDDFLINPARTELLLDSNLGQFPVTLTDCVSAQPIDKPTGDWRIELHTGTVLIGQPVGAQVKFALPMGPDSITVPLEHFAALERQNWGPVEPAVAAYVPEHIKDYRDELTVERIMVGMPLDEAKLRREKKESQAKAVAPSEERVVDSWFDNDGLRHEREAQYQD